MNELQHHGIKGQRWGVRRFQNSDGTLTSAGKKRQKMDGSKEKTPPHEDYVKAHSKKRIEEMSDKELRNRLNRLDMEKRYKQIPPEQVSKGQNFAKSILKAGTTVATVTSTALTIYNNWNTIQNIVKKKSG